MVGIIWANWVATSTVPSAFHPLTSSSANPRTCGASPAIRGDRREHGRHAAVAVGEARGGVLHHLLLEHPVIAEPLERGLERAGEDLLAQRGADAAVRAPTEAEVAVRCAVEHHRVGRVE